MKLFIISAIIFLCSSLAAASPITSDLAELPNLEGLIEVSGTTDGYERSISRRPDRLIDFSLVFPALSIEKIQSFDLNSILSPTSVPIKIFSWTFDIPSNFSLPLQRERYTVPIKVNKPNFKNFVPQHGDYKIAAVHGQFKVKTVVEKFIAGKPIFDLLNDFEFIGGGQLDINTTNKTSSIDVNIKGFTFDNKVAITAPDYNDKELTLFSMPLEAIDGDFYPSDLKYLKSGQKIKVSVSKNSNPKLSLNILSDKIKQYSDPFQNKDVDKDSDLNSLASLYAAEFNRISMSFTALEDKLTPQFLSFIEQPKIIGNSLSFKPPTLLPEVSPLATVVELVEAYKFKNGKLISEMKTSIWKKTIPGWVTETELPYIILPKKQSTIYRYEVSFFAADKNLVKPAEQELDLNIFSLLTKNYLVIE